MMTTAPFTPSIVFLRRDVRTLEIRGWRTLFRYARSSSQHDANSVEAHCRRARLGDEASARFCWAARSLRNIGKRAEFHMRQARSRSIPKAAFATVSILQERAFRAPARKLDNPSALRYQIPGRTLTRRLLPSVKGTDSIQRWQSPMCGVLRQERLHHCYQYLQARRKIESA